MEGEEGMEGEDRRGEEWKGRMEGEGGMVGGGGRFMHRWFTFIYIPSIFFSFSFFSVMFLLSLPPA